MNSKHCLVPLAATLLLLGGCAGGRSSVVQAPIVDLKGVNLADYEQDRAECEVYAAEVNVGGQVAVGTASGAAGGAVFGAVAGNSSTAKRGAGIGGLFGGMSSASRALSERNMVLRNCLRGRGYRVLN